MKHFKIRTDLKKEFLGITLFQVELTVDCKWGKKGDLGGWIEKESNLTDNAWVCGNAQVYGDARVYGDAWVYGNAQVYGDARVYGDAWVCGDAQVYGNAQVYGDAWVCGNAHVYGDAQVYGDARVCGDAQVEKYGQCIVISNLKYNITCTPNQIQIGCKSWTSLSDFEKNYKQIGKENGYTTAEAEQTALFVRAAMILMK